MTITAADFRLTPSGTGVGAVLETADLAALTADPAFLDQIQVWMDRHYVLHICAETLLSPASIEALAHRLGMSKGPYEGRRGPMKGFEFIGDFSAKGREDDGRARIPTFIESLHYDTYGKQPEAYAFSHTRQVPKGAPQLFVDMRAVYRDLPADLKTLVTGRNALHGRTPLPSQPLSAAPEFEKDKASVRPLVLAHWRTGEPLLFLPKHPDSLVEGLADDEGRALLHDLWDRTQTSPHRYISPMRSNDLVIWDNIGVTHTNPAYERGADRTVWFFTVPSPHSLRAYA